MHNNKTIHSYQHMLFSNCNVPFQNWLQILSDTKELQKEINNLTGKLDRTFAVTDEMVFKVIESLSFKTFYILFYMFDCEKTLKVYFYQDCITTIRTNLIHAIISSTVNIQPIQCANVLMSVKIKEKMSCICYIHVRNNKLYFTSSSFSELNFSCFYRRCLKKVYIFPCTIQVLLKAHENIVYVCDFIFYRMPKKMNLFANLINTWLPCMRYV